MAPPEHSTTEGGRLASFVVRTDGLLLKLTSGLALLGMCALVVAIAVVAGDIIWRRVGGGSFIGSVDLTQFSVMIAVSMAIPYAFSIGAHVSIDLLTRSLGAWANRILETCASLTGLIITGFLCWLSYGRAREIWTYGDVSQDLALPMIWVWGALVCGLALSALVCAIRALRTLLSGIY